METRIIISKKLFQEDKHIFKVYNKSAKFTSDVFRFNYFSLYSSFFLRNLNKLKIEILNVCQY